ASGAGRERRSRVDKPAGRRGYSHPRPHFGREADTPMQPPTVPTPRPAYRTAGGRLYVGDAADALASPALRRWRGRVQLVFTSPPFPLCRKKEYGNLRGDAYADWLAGFAQPLADYLTPTGSIVLELGNGWESGQPTVSTASVKALLA